MRLTMFMGEQSNTKETIGSGRESGVHQDAGAPTHARLVRSAHRGCHDPRRLPSFISLAHPASTPEPP